MANLSIWKRLTKPRSRVWALLMVLVLLAAACSGSDAVTDAAAEVADAVSGDDSGDEVEAMEDDAMEDDEASFDEDSAEVVVAAQGNDDSDGGPAAGDQASDPLGSGGTVDAPDTATLGREIIFAARLSVEVDNVAVAGAEATQIISDIGGFVFGQETSGGNEPRSEITFKVLPADFSEALESLGGIGELRNQSISTDDVTERVVDLNSRIEVAELGVERLRETLEETTGLNNFARVEELLLQREEDLAVMRGQLRTLRDQIDLSTITLVLVQDRVENSLSLQVSAYEGRDNGARCPANNLGDQRFEPGDEITLCFLTRNDGEQTLRDVTVTETALAIEGNDDLITVFGEDELRPGQTFVQAVEIDVDRDLFLRIGATGVPTDGVSDEQAAPLVNAEQSPEIRVNEVEVDPGFGDGFGAGVGLLAGIWGVITIVAGFLIPLLVFVPFLLLAWFGVRRSRANNAAKRQARIEASMPSPPQAPVMVDHDEPAHGENE